MLMREWALGFLLGTIAAAWLPGVPAQSVLFLAVCLGCAVSVVTRGLPRVVVALVIGASLSALQGSGLVAARIDSNCVGESLRVQGRIASLPVLSLLPDGTERRRFLFVAESLKPSVCAGPVRLLLSRYGPGELQAGQRWHFDVKLKKPWGRANPWGFSSQSWYANQQIHALGHVEGRSRSVRLEADARWRYQHHVARHRIAEAIDAVQLPAQVAAVLRALTIADSSGLSSEVQRALRSLGVSHLLVISGLHIGLVGGLGLLLGKLLVGLTGGHRLWQSWLPVILALACAVFYSLLASFTLPTLRALIMLGVFLITRAAGRWRQGWNSLLMAALVVLLLNPLAVTGSGFWLSFGAVAALLWFSGWRAGAGRNPSIPARLFATHFYMSLIMLPLGGWFFGGGSLVAGVANMVLIPLVGFYIVPLALLGAFAALWGLGLAALCWELAALPLRWLLPLATSEAASDAGMFWHFHSSSIAFLLALIGLVLLLLPDQRRVGPFAAMLALPLLLPEAGIAPEPSRELTVTVFDVGQGTAVLIQAGERALLYDTGPGDPNGRNAGEDLLRPALSAAGIRTLDTLVVSHGDLDHSAGAQTLLSQIPVRRLRRGADGFELPGSSVCQAGESWRWPGGQRFRFLSPALYGSTSGTARNNASCVLQVDIDGYRMLLAGDVERPGELEAVVYWRDALRSQWLLVAHHGSATSSSYSKLKHTQPAVAVVSAGYRNNFRHPHPSVVARLDAFGAELLDTAREGALEFRIRDGQLQETRAYRRGSRPYWW